MKPNALIDTLRTEDKFILACLQKQSNLARFKIDEPTLLHRMSYHRITSMVYSHVLKINEIDRFSKNTQAALKSHYQVNILHNLMIQQLARQIAEVLSAKNIDVLFLKGAAFLNSFPEYDLVREMNDLDIMVRSSYLYQALETLQEIGFKDSIDFSLSKNTFKNWYKKLSNNALQLYGSNGGFSDTIVELHWQLFSPILNYTSWIEKQLWSRSCSFSEDKFYHLDPIDNLLHLCTHECNNFQIFLYGLVDIFTLLSHWESKIDWEQAIYRAKAQGIFYHLINVLQLCHQLLLMPLPEIYNDSLRHHEQKAAPGYDLLLEWLFYKEWQDGVSFNASDLDAFRNLEGQNIWRSIKFLIPYNLRQGVRDYFAGHFF